MNPELGVYRLHYTRFGPAQALFFGFVLWLASVIRRPPNFYKLFYHNFSTYAWVYTVLRPAAVTFSWRNLRQFYKISKRFWMLNLMMSGGRKPIYWWVQEAWGLGVQSSWHLSPLWLPPYQHCHSRTPSSRRHSSTILTMKYATLLRRGPVFYVHWYHRLNSSSYRKCGIDQKLTIN